jgi:hypothetical protein
MKTFPAIEPKVLLLRSHEPASGPYPEPDEFSPHPPCIKQRVMTKIFDNEWKRKAE